MKKLLKDGGRFVTAGGMDVVKETRDQLAKLKELFETGQLRAVTDREYSMVKIRDAHAYVEQGKKRGNVVLLMPKETPLKKET